MATEWEYIGGILKWVQCDVPNRWGKWAVQVYPDAPSLEKLRDMQARGLRNQIKKDDDGWYTRFGRPTQIQLRTGKIVGLTAPELLDGRPERKLPSGDCPPLKGVVIGNGSKGVVKLEVYKFESPDGSGKGIAARLYSIRVDDLIPFERERDFTEQQAAAVQGLDEQPEAMF